MIVPMKRLILLVARGERDEALRRLRRLGVVHVKPVREPASAEMDGLAEQSARLEKALALLGAEEKRPGAAAAPASFEDGMRVVDAVLDLDGRRERARSRLREAEAQRSWLKEWGDPSRSDMESLAKADIKIRLYRADAAFLKRLPEHGQAFVVGRDKGRVRLAWLTRGEEPGLELKEEAFPEAEVSALEAEIAAGRAALTRMAREVEALSERREALRAYARHLRRSADLARVRAGMGMEEELVYLEGYCPGDRLSEVTSLAAAHSWGWLASEPEDPSEVPTLIRNPGWIQAIQPLFKFMGTLPGYAEADVSPWFLDFLSLFCAMLIGDAGYGLLFLGAALWARRKAKPGTPPDLFRMMILFSLATILWGALSGVYFGSAAVARLPVLRSLVVPALDGFVEANSASLMYLCFIIGLAHLTLAHLLNVVRLWPSPRLLGQVGWIAIVWAVFFLVGNLVSGKPLPGFFGPLLIGGVLSALVFSNFQRRILKGVAATLVDLPLSIISTFSDLMSYLRLFAVGFASLTVAGSFNAMAAGSGIRSVGQGIMAAVILLFGHSLNLVLGAMSVLVHGVRLNMLEFSNHLGQQWSGQRYEPFREGEVEERGRNPERKEQP
jgi:V/A-type H+-transporting ATPase subunit I